MLHGPCLHKIVHQANKSQPLKKGWLQGQRNQSGQSGISRTIFWASQSHDTQVYVRTCGVRMYNRSAAVPVLIYHGI